MERTQLVYPQEMMPGMLENWAEAALRENRAMRSRTDEGLDCTALAISSTMSRRSSASSHASSRPRGFPNSTGRSSSLEASFMECRSEKANFCHRAGGPRRKMEALPPEVSADCVIAVEAGASDKSSHGYRQSFHHGHHRSSHAAANANRSLPPCTRSRRSSV